MMNYKERIKMIEEMSKDITTNNEKKAIELSIEIIQLEQQIGKGSMKIEDIAAKILEKKLEILSMVMKKDTKAYKYLEGVKEVFDVIKLLDDSDFRTEMLSKIEKKVNYFIDRMKEESREDTRDQKES